MASENILTFKIGDETRPKVEPLLVEHNQVDRSTNTSTLDETPFFYDVYEKAITLIAEILNQNDNVNERSDGYNHPDFDLLTQSRNNIIAFVGDRGSGKTSSMKTIYTVLRECRSEHNYTIKFRSLSSGYNVIKQYHIVTLPTIDPSYFEARHNILDIVVAHMFDAFQRKSKSANINNIERNTKHKQELIRMFQDVKTCLDIIKQKPNELNETIEDLSALASGINLKESVRNLIKSYLKYFVDNERAVLAIAIDDIDLQTRYAYEMVEQIRKYLVQPNVLILMGVKISQLHDLVKQYYYNENHDLISANLLTDTPENMAGRYLSKLIPFNQRIFMPNIGEHCNKQIRIIENENISDNCNTIKGTISSVVLNLIFIKTRYLFYHTGSNPSLIVPRNLRDLLNLLSLLYHMPEIPEKSQKTNAETEEDFQKRQNEIIRKNRSRFRNYFVDTWCSENLSATMFAFIKELETLEVNQINKRVIDFLIQLDNKKEVLDGKKGSNLENEIINVGNRCYNISLGDVCYTLDKISNNYGIRYINNFVFAVKTLYSFFFYQLFEDKESDVEERLDYLQMQYDLKPRIKHKHLLKMTKMMVLSGYEQLLAGNLIRVTKLTNAIKSNQDNRQSKTESPNSDNNRENSYYHLREINKSKLNDLNQYITNNYKGKDTEKNPVLLPNGSETIDWKSAFNIWEFFILTAYLNTNHTYFRTQKQCYYLHIPDNFPLNFKDPIIYSSTAILFNIVKFYDCYVLCENKTHNGSAVLENKNWTKFWDIIRANKEISILWKILNYSESHSSNTENSSYSHIEQGKMPNHELEKIFIRNMEVLDTLEEHLPYLKRKHIYYEGEKIHNVLDVYTDFYKKLSKFQFSLLPRSIQSIREQTKVTDGITSISFSALSAIPAFLNDLNNNDDKKSDNLTSAQRLFYQIMINK